jgi:hypothetical protein
MSYPKGAEWRKWDLHVHSPESAFANEFAGATSDEKWSNYIRCLEELEDVAVIGITDYFCIDGYAKALAFQKLGRLKNITLLPNIEMRLDRTTKKGVAINIHVIFDPSIVDMVDSVFLSSIKQNIDSNYYSCTKKDLIRLGRDYVGNPQLEDGAAFKAGANQFKVPLNSLKEALRANKKLHGKYLVVVPNSQRDGNSGNTDDNFTALRDDLYKFADCIFTGNPEDREFFLGKKEKGLPVDVLIERFGSLKPCIHGSDAHQLDRVCQPDLGRFTWIKADPTFGGLKQILFEPEDRVRIQKDSPVLEYPKAHFSSLRASGGIFDDAKPCFKHCSIPLNRNLVALIGGRGTGKSLLLDVMHRTFNEVPVSENKEQNRLARIGSPDFEIALTKSDGEKAEFKHNDGHFSFDYLHVRQGEVKEVAEDKEKLAKSIKKLLGFIQENSRAYQSKNITMLNREHDELQKWLEKTDGNGNRVNSYDYQNNLKSQLVTLIGTITTKDTKDKIALFSENSSQIGRLNKAQEEASIFKNEIIRTEDRINKQIVSLNGKGLGISPMIDEIKLNSIIVQLDTYITSITSRLKQLDSDNKKISEDLLEKGIKGDISGLLDKVNEY